MTSARAIRSKACCAPEVTSTSSGRQATARVRPTCSAIARRNWLFPWFRCGLRDEAGLVSSRRNCRAMTWRKVAWGNRRWSTRAGRKSATAGGMTPPPCRSCQKPIQAAMSRRSQKGFTRPWCSSFDRVCVAIELRRKSQTNVPEPCRAKSKPSWASRSYTS